MSFGKVEVPNVGYIEIMDEDTLSAAEFLLKYLRERICWKQEKTEEPEKKQEPVAETKEEEQEPIQIENEGFSEKPIERYPQKVYRSVLDDILPMLPDRKEFTVHDVSKAIEQWYQKHPDIRAKITAKSFDGLGYAYLSHMVKKGLVYKSRYGRYKKAGINEPANKGREYISAWHEANKKPEMISIKMILDKPIEGMDITYDDLVSGFVSLISDKIVTQIGTDQFKVNS